MEKSEDLSGEWQIVSSVYETGLEKNEKNMDEKSTGDSSKVAEGEDQASGSGVQDLDQGNAALHDSSSSDIELIDETLEENTVNCVLPSSSLSISSSIDKTSETCSSETSISSSAISNIVPSQVEDIDETKTEESERNEEQAANANNDRPEAPWTIGGRTIYDWLILILHFLENMNGWQWSIAIAVTLCFSTYITVNITNVIARQERGNVVSQMKEMIEELKNDNKMLRDQMMSEMKNDKMLTSFEHQIRELKKENSKLNHMLFDVVKVLEKQKDSQEKLLEKKESEYLAPFKKEINKLKEHINILKFDNEELQKQLVRMRYASYSQGGKHADESKTHGKDKKENKADSTKHSETEIPLDLKELKKWNELIDMLAKELGLSGKDYASKDEKPHDYTKKKDWGWNAIKRNLKGTFDNLHNINISDLLSKYFKYNEKAMSDIYKSVSNYFNSAQENAQQIYDSFNFEDEATHAEQKGNIWDTLKDLSGKWAEMKNKFYSSYLKKSFSSTKKGFEKSGTSEDIHEHSGVPKAERSDPEKTTDFSKAEKHDRVSVDPEKKDWQFERAAHRAELREGEEEPSVNWFLKKGKQEGDETREEDSANKRKWTFEL